MDKFETAKSHFMAGLAAQQKSDWQGAEREYAAALRLFPDRVSCLVNISHVLVKLQRLDDARKHAEKAASLDPENPAALSQLGAVLVSLHRFEEAFKWIEQCLAIDPNLVEALINKASALVELSRHGEAITVYETIIRLQPAHPTVHLELTKTLSRLQVYSAALTAVDKAIAINPGLVDAHVQKGLLLNNMGDPQQAIAVLDAALKLDPNHVGLLCALGQVYADLNRPTESFAHLDKARSVIPPVRQVYINSGYVYAQFGNFPEALTAFKHCLAANPLDVEALCNICRYEKAQDGGAFVPQLNELLSDGLRTPDERARINFALAKAYEDLKDFGRSFEHLREGNKLIKQMSGYDIKKDRDRFETLKRNAPLFKHLKISPPSSSKGPVPIFIVGMPRSGTTLVEQILSSHSKVAAGGELPTVGVYGHRLAAGEVPCTLEGVKEFREQYLRHLKIRAGSKPFCTDKMPHNFRYLALICCAFPEAIIIHVRRSAKAVCWSNYKNNFGGRGLDYSNDLKDVVAYHGLFSDFMNFSQDLLGDRILDLDYEKLTTSPEAEVRGLIKAVGLRWESACLRPEDNSRSVKTVSIAQVRNPVYAGSSQSWKKYETFLGPEFSGLTVEN